MSILVIAEYHGEHIAPATYSAIAAGCILSDDGVDCLIAGDNITHLAQSLAQTQGVRQVLLTQHTCYAHQLPEALAPLVESIAAQYTHIIGPATTFGKNLLPRIAALLDTAMLSDVTEIHDAQTFTRPIYAGNAFATLKSLESQKILSVRPTSFDTAYVEQAAAPIVTLDIVFEQTQSQFLELAASHAEGPELTSAKVVISGGRGLKSKENFQLIEALANKLNAAVGASRAAVDAGYIENDAQVGQTGKVVAPELYIAVGISGAIQHLAGMKDAKVIVAINQDPDAPIFEIADYGLVGDLFDIVPALTKAL